MTDIERKWCRRCNEFLPVERFDVSQAGKLRLNCRECCIHLDGRKYRLREWRQRVGPGTPPPVAEIGPAFIRNLIREYTSVRFDATTESAELYRSLRSALKVYGGAIPVAGRVWRYDRGIGDLASCAAPQVVRKYVPAD